MVGRAEAEVLLGLLEETPQTQRPVETLLGTAGMVALMEEAVEPTGIQIGTIGMKTSKSLCSIA
jgi:hypothetical protein